MHPTDPLRSTQSHPFESPDEVNMMKLLSKIHIHEAQKSLLSETLKSKVLLDSKIISSLHPKVGRTFSNMDIENRKNKILGDARKKLIMLALEEKEKELQEQTDEFNRSKQLYTENNTRFSNVNAR